MGDKGRVLERDILLRLCRTCAGIQSRSIFHVLSARDLDDMQARAELVTERLERVAESLGGECPFGTVFDEATGDCIPLF